MIIFRGTDSSRLSCCFCFSSCLLALFVVLSILFSLSHLVVFLIVFASHRLVSSRCLLVCHLVYTLLVVSLVVFLVVFASRRLVLLSPRLSPRLSSRLYSSCHLVLLSPLLVVSSCCLLVSSWSLLVSLLWWMLSPFFRCYFVKMPVLSVLGTTHSKTLHRQLSASVMSVL